MIYSPGQPEVAGGNGDVFIYLIVNWLSVEL